MNDLYKDRARCEVCRTINLAKNAKYGKPNMEMYDKCAPIPRRDCPPCLEPTPDQLTRITICKKNDYASKIPPPPAVPKPHSKCSYLLKAGILVGSVYFTYAQGIWGEQQEVTAFIERWKGYLRSLNVRRSPTYDQCGNAIIKENKTSLVAPLYDIYKYYVMSCFTSVAKTPMQLKCAYVEYIKTLEKKWDDALKNKK